MNKLKMFQVNFEDGRSGRGRSPWMSMQILAVSIIIICTPKTSVNRERCAGKYKKP